MANNRHLYGFRWVGSVDGACYPKPREFIIASAAQPTPEGANTGFSIGDPVDLLTDGTVMLSGDANYNGPFYGVIVSINNAKVDANSRARPTSYLPGGVTWANKQQQSRVGVVPFGRNIWEIDCNTALANEAAFQLLIGANCDMIHVPDTSNADKPRANPFLNISTANTTATLAFRIFGISKSMDNVDFSGTNVKLLVVGNQIFDPMSTAAGELGV